jgi:hypothetical protein
MAVVAGVFVVLAESAAADDPPRPVPLPRLVTVTADGKGNLEFEYSMHQVKPVTTMPPGAKFPVTTIATVTIPKKQIVRLVDVVVHDCDGKKLGDAQTNERLKKPTVVVVFGKGSYGGLNFKSVVKDETLIVFAPTVELP